MFIALSFQLSKSRLSTPEFSGYHCMYLTFSLKEPHLLLGNNKIITCNYVTIDIF